MSQGFSIKGSEEDRELLATYLSRAAELAAQLEMWHDNIPALLSLRRMEASVRGTLDG